MIPLFKMSVNQSDIDAVTKVLNRGTSWADGSEIEEFEQKICDYMKIKYCLTFNSGTSALHTLMIAYDIGRGDEVIVPSFTFIATANCIKMVGAKPVFADIEDETLGLDPYDIAGRITDKTRAIICVHYGGCPCRVKELQKVARSYNLIFIEDNAESMGAEVNGVKLGTIGDAGVLSFCQNKIITTGEGGAVITNSEGLYEKLKLIRSHGRQDGDYFGGNKLDYITLGYNWRMPSMNAALGISQLERIDSLIAKRRGNAVLYDLHLPVNEIQIRQSLVDQVFQMYSIRCKDRDKLREHLQASNISSGVWFNPIHLTEYYQSLGYADSLPVTEKVSQEILSLPMYPDQTNDDIITVCNSIKEFYGVKK